MNWKRAISLGLATILSVGTLAGCGGSDDPLSEYSKAEVIQMYRDLEYEKNDLQIQIDEMNAVLSALDEGQAPTAAISSTGDGSGGMTFNSYEMYKKYLQSIGTYQKILGYSNDLWDSDFDKEIEKRFYDNSYITGEYLTYSCTDKQKVLTRR